MPDGQNAERVERLISTLEELHPLLVEDRRRLTTLVGQVEALQRDRADIARERRKDRQLSGVLAVLVLAVAALAVSNWRDGLADDRQNCRVLNEVGRSTRERALRFYAAIDRRFGDDPAIGAEIDSLVRDVLAEERNDRDCNRNGTVGDAGDYPNR